MSQSVWTMARIVYFILCHKDPERIARLINQLKTDSDFIRAHFDTSIGKRKFTLWKQFIEQQYTGKNLEIVSEFRCAWGSFGGVNATLKAMQQYKNRDYEYFVNLSGECYPVKPAHVIKKTFDNQTLAFMEAFKLPTSLWGKGGMERLWYKYYFFSIGKHSKFIRIPRLSKKIPCDLKPYGGSAFFCLPKPQVNYVLEFLDQNPAVKKYFERAGLIDEIFFQTILKNSPFRSQINGDNKRYIDWNKSEDGHPRFLTSADVEDLINSDKLFARKISSTIDKDILDIIDQKLANWTK